MKTILDIEHTQWRGNPDERPVRARRRPLHGAPAVQRPDAEADHRELRIRHRAFSVAVTAGLVNDFTLSMADLIRTRALMGIYQYYRISTVEMRFKPLSDNYLAGGADQLPYLYFQYDKSGSLQGLNAQNFERDWH